MRASSAASVESSEVIPRPITRRPLDELDPEDEEPDALRELVEPDEPEALLPLLPLPLPLLLEPLPALLGPLLELFPPLALIPLLLRFGMLILG